jgi:hypothetical protein
MRMTKRQWEEYKVFNDMLVRELQESEGDKAFYLRELINIRLCELKESINDNYIPNKRLTLLKSEVFCDEN